MIVKEILNIILSQSFRTRGYIAVSVTAFYTFCTCGNYAYIPIVLDVKKVFEYGSFDYPRISSILLVRTFKIESFRIGSFGTFQIPCNDLTNLSISK